MWDRRPACKARTAAHAHPHPSSLTHPAPEASNRDPHQAAATSQVRPFSLRAAARRLPRRPSQQPPRGAHPALRCAGAPKPGPVPRAADGSLGGAPAASSSPRGRCAGDLPGGGQGKREEKRRRRGGVSPGFGVRGQGAGLPKSGYPRAHPLQPEPLLPRLARGDSRHLHLMPYMLCRGRQGKCRDNMVISILSHVAISISDVRGGGRRKCREVFFSFTSPALFSLQALAQGANRRTYSGCALSPLSHLCPSER